MLLDSCIHSSLRTNAELFYKARVLSAIICVYFAIITAVDIWLLFFSHSRGAGLQTALLICVGMQLSYISALFLLRSKGLYSIIANLIIGITSLGITGGIATSGGPLIAPATPLNILPIIMAFVLINKRAGIIWTQLILASHCSLIAAESYGFSFPQMLAVEFMGLQHIAHWIIIYTALMGLMIVHSSLSDDLKQALNDERSKFKHMASHDPLTGLANRHQFDENLSKSLNRSDRHQKSTALFFLDLDGFKPINDTLGHDVGDIVLQEISIRLQQNVRELDTVARLGGDEFAIVLEDVEHDNDIKMIANKLLNIIQQPIEQIPSKPSVSGSIGISKYPQHSEDKIQLIKCADIAMYKAKHSKNAWVYYEHAMQYHQQPLSSHPADKDASAVKAS